MGIAARIARVASIGTLTLGVSLAVFAAGPPAARTAGSAAARAGSAAFYAAARVEFRQAYARASEGDIDPSRDSESLKRYPLYPYLEAARIRQALSGTLAPPDAADERAAAFIAAHAREPVSGELRRAWLESLARRSRWSEFLRAYRQTEAGSALRCQSFTARIALGRTEGLARDIERLWLTPASLPECARPFAWLEERGLLTPALIEQRVRLALIAGKAPFAREIARRLPPDRAAPLLEWASLLESPERAIDTLLASRPEHVDPAALLAGWSRLARQDPEAAEARFPSLLQARDLSGESANAYALTLALGLAWDRDPAALDYFDRVPAGDLTDSAIEWRVRVALWTGDWRLASQAIGALSQRDRQTPRWRYWGARIAEHMHDAADARRLYESILPDDDYYSAMAAARLGRPVVAHPNPLPLDRAILASLGRVPALIRARELFLCGMEPEAELEWRLGLKGLSAPERLQTIHLAASWGWYDQAIEAATSERVFYDYALLYPRPFDAAVDAAARRSGLEPQIIYGVLRQESLYRADAVSSAGARGLMQLELGTARRTASFWRHRRPSASDLFDPDINISLGSERLKMLLDRFEGQLPVALAAYNAGINAAARWLPPRPVDADVWIENIPFNETREYVERVLWHRVLYAWLRSQGEPQRVATWLERVTPVQRVASDDSRRMRSGP